MIGNVNSRRQFIKNTSICAAAIPLYGAMADSSSLVSSDKLNIHIFSKHLQFLDYPEMAKMAAQIGFDGVDLTVRPSGHVLPERVEEDLPKAIDAMGNAGLPPLMMATAVNDATNPVNQAVLKTASGLGMKYYRMGYFRYTKDGSIPDDVKAFQQRTNALGVLNSELGLVGCYQNHAGNYVGASMFELYDIFRKGNSESTGLQYDIRHATVEGGKSWETGLRLVEGRIKTMVLKDFRWENKDGAWDAINTPLGEGMVDFKRYFSLLKKYQIKAPVSLHLEYPIGGAEHGDREISIAPDKVYQAMQKDLEYAHKTWQEA